MLPDDVHVALRQTLAQMCTALLLKHIGSLNTAMILKSFGNALSMQT